MKTPLKHSSTLLRGSLALLVLTGCNTKDRVDVNRVETPVAVVTNPVILPQPVVAVQTAPTQTPPAPVPAPIAIETPKPKPVAVAGSPAIQEVIKLAKAGVPENVMLTFIANSGMVYKPSADEIVLLNDLGVSETVIEALMKGVAPKDGANLAAVNETVPPSSPAQPATPPVATTEQAAQQQYVVAQPVPGNTAPAPQAAPAPAPAPAQPAPVVVAQPSVTYATFYDSLSPYGTWIDYPGYGVCWQPTVAVTVSGWRPYGHRGRWLFTDVGWYWHSDYSWGWAPFHYGRWVHTTRCGWIWTPGYEWAPAWVSWRNHYDHCGWAPLPPEATFSVGVGLTFRGTRVSAGFAWGLRDHHYTFIPKGRLVDRDPWNHHVPFSKRTEIYKDSTVVNNYIVGNNNTIVNNGIARDQITTFTKTEIRKVPMREVERPSGGAAKPMGGSSEVAEVAVYRPKMEESKNRTPAKMAIRSHESAPKPQMSLDGSNLNRPSKASINTPVSATSTPSGLVGSRPSATGISASPSGGVIAPRPTSITPSARTSSGNVASTPQSGNTPAVVPSQSPTASPTVGERAKSSLGSNSGAVARTPESKPSAPSQRSTPGLIRPQQANANSGVTASVPNGTVQPQSTPSQSLRPTPNGSSAFRPGASQPPPSNAPLNPTGFRQDLRKVEAQPSIGAVPPKFQNQSQGQVGLGATFNTAPSRTIQTPQPQLGGAQVNPYVGAPPRTGFRGPQQSQPTQPQFTPSQAPAPAPPRAVPSGPGPSRPQSAQGGGRDGGGRNENPK